MKFSFKRPITSYHKVRVAIAALLRNRSFLINRKAIAGKQYLDLGCGPNPHTEFINLDYSWHPEIDICWDITRNVPVESESMTGIFTEHCLEHLPFGSIDRVLSECWRILKPGGTLRIIVPDGELYLTQYARILAGEKIALPYADDDRHGQIYSPIMSVNRIFRAHGHLFIYDFDTLRQLLVKHEFVNVVKESLGSGRDSRLLIDTPSRAIESLYIEASKPSAFAPYNFDALRLQVG